MQRIQDKELDQLFNDKLANAELEPPAAVWTNIEQQIQPKRKRFLPVYWLAAAVAVVAVTAGLLFTNDEKVILQGKPEVVATPVIENPIEKTGAATILSETKIAEKTAAVLKVKKSVAKQFPKKELLAMQPLASKDHLNITGPENEVLRVSEMQIEVKALPTEEVALALVNTPLPVTEDVIEENSQPERKGINNIGDLVNFVVEKVDKREQKFLKFKTDDDDNSSLVAINIGIIKLNGKHKAKR